VLRQIKLLPNNSRCLKIIGYRIDPTFCLSSLGWVLRQLPEVLERQAIPATMDILGVYAVRLDNEGNLLSFERKRLRKRGETGEA